jgi:hypothetical protein
LKAEKDVSSELTAALVRMLRPLVRLLLRRGVSLKSLYELLKWLFVDVAAEEFGPGGRHRAVSRISAMTGLTRKEVARLISLPESRDNENKARYNRAVRVITGWRRDRDFSATRGGPAALDLKGEGPTFTELVRRYSGDMTPKAMLDELLRIGAVRILRGGRIKLMVRSFIPGAGDGERLHILGDDVGHLIRTIDHNLECTDLQAARFQRKVSYDNLPAEALREFRNLSAENAQRLLEKLDEWLSRWDRDTNPEVKGEGRYTAGLGIYYFEEKFPNREGGDER